MATKEPGNSQGLSPTALKGETIEGAEAAIDGSIDHFAKKLEASARS
jgi:hypothetical protein